MKGCELISCERFGALHSESLRLQHNVAVVCLNAGLHADAERILQGVWRGRCQTLGSGHPSTLRSLGELLEAQQAFILRPLS